MRTRRTRPTAHPTEAALHHQIDLAREALEADGFPVWRVDGFEGDDVIATCNRASKKLTSPDVDHDVLIASADKDLLALVGDHVEVHNTRTGNRMGPAEVKEKLGVDPGQVVDYLTLVGDASDNIKGAKGIGPKNAAGILNIFGNLDDRLPHSRQRRRRSGSPETGPESEPGRTAPRGSMPSGRWCGCGLTCRSMSTRYSSPALRRSRKNSTMYRRTIQRKAKGETAAVSVAESVPRLPSGNAPSSRARWTMHACSPSGLHESRMFGAYGTPQAVL